MCLLVKFVVFFVGGYFLYRTTRCRQATCRRSEKTQSCRHTRLIQF